PDRHRGPPGRRGHHGAHLRVVGHGDDVPQVPRERRARPPDDLRPHRRRGRGHRELRRRPRLRRPRPPDPGERMSNIEQTLPEEGDRLENAIELKEVEGLSQGQIVLRRFLRHKGAMAGLVVLLGVVILATTSIGWGPIPGWWKGGGFGGSGAVEIPGGRPTLQVFGEKGLIYIGNYPFGQDEIGRDMFALTMRGTQQSLMMMVIIGLIATAIGVLIGAFAGFFRGALDN